MDERRCPARGWPSPKGGTVTSGTHSPSLDVGIGMGYVPAAPRRRRARPLTIDVRGTAKAAHVVKKPIYTRKETLGGAAESYPEGLLYHPEHDWARIEGDEAVLGITWFAQDALGELVHFEAPAVGATTAKDESYGEVESVKAVSDVIAPLSGEIARGEPEGRRRARDRQRRPVRRGLARPHPARRPGEVDGAARRGRLPGARRGAVRCRAGYLALTDDDREQMLAAIGVASVDELFAQIPAAVRLDRRARRAAGAQRGRARRATSRSSRRRTSHTGVELSFLGAGIYDHYVPAIVDTILQRGEFLTAYTPYQPEMSQGVAAGDLRVPDARSAS